MSISKITMMRRAILDVRNCSHSRTLQQNAVKLLSNENNKRSMSFLSQCLPNDRRKYRGDFAVSRGRDPGNILSDLFKRPTGHLNRVGNANTAQQPFCL